MTFLSIWSASNDFLPSSVKTHRILSPKSLKRILNSMLFYIVSRLSGYLNVPLKCTDVFGHSFAFQSITATTFAEAPLNLTPNLLEEV